MTNSSTVEDRISLWLEEEAVSHLPDRVFETAFVQTRELRQVGSTRWRPIPMLRSTATLAAAGAALVLVLVIGFAFFRALPGPAGPATATDTAPATTAPSPTTASSPTTAPSPTFETSPTPSQDATAAPPSATPIVVQLRDPFLGVWISTSDLDGGIQTMTVEKSGDSDVEIVVTDTIASVCGGTPSTMTGAGVVQNGKLVIPTPDYTCDDGSKPKAIGGKVPLKELLRNTTYALNTQTGELHVGPDSVWRRSDAPTPSADPSAIPGSPAPSPIPGQTTFTSDIHGFSFDYPSDWQTRSATEAWAGGEIGFDSPAADVVFDPEYADHLYLLVASQAYGHLTDDEWRNNVLAWTCPGDGGGQMWSWHVDGVYSWQQAPCNSGTIVQGADRGYLIRLVAAEGLANTYNWDWLKSVLETVDLRPEDAV